jgi:small basic protein
MAALSAIDAVAGGAKKGQRGAFSAAEFLEGALSTALLACALTWLGGRLDVQLHLAVAAALCVRIFGNLSSALEKRERSAFLRGTIGKKERE